MNTDDYMQGMRDCKDNKDHKSGQSKSYDDGYAAQYSFDAVRDEMTVQQESVMYGSK